MKITCSEAGRVIGSFFVAALPIANGDIREVVPRFSGIFIFSQALFILAECPSKQPRSELMLQNTNFASIRTTPVNYQRPHRTHLLYPQSTRIGQKHVQYAISRIKMV